tara:strand:+ start:111 stop:311 length:201 start_codon:yes stop_codon:yes gene_type:complete
MASITYKKWHIDHVYDCSKGYDEINHFAIWTPNRLDMVAEEFPTIKAAKLWINQHTTKRKKHDNRN